MLIRRLSAKCACSVLSGRYTMKLSAFPISRSFWVLSSILALSLVFLCWHALSVIRPADVGLLPWRSHLPRVLEAVFFITSFFTIRSLLRMVSFYNTEEKLAGIAGAGLLVLGITLVPTGMAWTGNPLPAGSATLLLLEGLQFIFLTLLFSGSALILTRLSGEHSSQWTHKLRPLFILILITATVSQIFYQSAAAAIVFYGTAGIVAFLMTYQSAWITYLARQSRVTAFTYLLAAFFVSSALFLKMYYQPTAGFLPISTEQSLFLHLTGGFVVLWCGWSLLVLFFHLPLAHVLDAREKESQNLVHMSQLAEERKEITAVTNSLVKTAMNQTGADGCWISEVDSQQPANKLMAREGISDNDRKRVEYTLHAHPAHYELDGGYPFVYIRNLLADPHLRDHSLNFRSLVIFPFQTAGEREWHLHLFTQQPQGFEEQSLRQLQTYITHARLTINNVSMLQSTLEKERLEHDIEIGKQVQQRLIPAHFPEHKNIAMAGASLAAEEVGGDYYDCHTMQDGRLAILMADVSGKGTSAAFHVAEMKGIFQSLMLGEPEPAAFLSQANKAIARCFDKGMFITVLYAVIDFDKPQVSYARGGHCPLLHFDAVSHKVQLLKDDGLGLGIVRDESYDQTIRVRTLPLHAGDLLVFYTDGIVEARSHETSGEYGYERLRDCVYLNLDLPPKQLTNKILQDVEIYTGGKAGRDDMSVLVGRLK